MELQKENTDIAKNKQMKFYSKFPSSGVIPDIIPMCGKFTKDDKIIEMINFAPNSINKIKDNKPYLLKKLNLSEFEEFSIGFAIFLILLIILLFIVCVGIKFTLYLFK
jgi:hypothetical protein